MARKVTDRKAAMAGDMKDTGTTRILNGADKAHRATMAGEARAVVTWVVTDRKAAMALKGMAVAWAAPVMVAATTDRKAVMEKAPAERDTKNITRDTINLDVAHKVTITAARTSSGAATRDVTPGGMIITAHRMTGSFRTAGTAGEIAGRITITRGRTIFSPLY